MFVTQYAEITEKKQLVTSGGLGTMGYGFPAAIGAKIGNPDRTVIAISGDGGMQMNIQEFATAVLEELPLILCVFNNEYLGMVQSVAETVLWKTLHLHYEVIHKGVPVNPINYFNRNMTAEEYERLMESLRETNFETL